MEIPKWIFEGIQKKDKKVIMNEFSVSFWAMEFQEKMFLRFTDNY